ncbi:hypothetical protein I6B53_02250 [Schaalia sp. 19OD2882]|uniref:hypothetical protein n=1 Tax=Schaalia sp. 19OD2882 TaxID=2794089 RepID=UPI001C1EACAF|nr:hypothetical protein [Schaalia sp. 19OD2882]QWW19955.1 hypothetical protein I6B53_02250 [Schaalia sp. 19OD2882]
MGQLALQDASRDHHRGERLDRAISASTLELTPLVLSEAEANDLVIGQSRSGVDESLDVVIKRIGARRMDECFEIGSAHLHASIEAHSGQSVLGDELTESGVAALSKIGGF